MSGKTILIWFRNDLRMHDNEVLIEAVNRAGKILPVYCFDPRYFTETSYGTKRSGYFRTKFLLESVESLREAFRERGGNLIIRIGKPEDVLPELCKQYGISEVYHHREVASEETEISAHVEDALWKMKINLKHFIGHTMFHKQDLPFPIKSIPNDFLVFKKKIERESIVRQGYESPDKLEMPLDVDWGPLPLMEEFGITPAKDIESDLLYTGGEKKALEIMNQLVEMPFSDFGILNPNKCNSAVLSPWLSLGCLSPRLVYWKVKEKLPPKSDLSIKIIIELQWRDFNRFMLKKHGPVLEMSSKKLKPAEKLKFINWKEGHTGELFVDACMQQLNATGFINNICKSFVSAYLIKKLKVQWLAGSAYFEEKAIDFSPAIDWGNWAIACDVIAYEKFANPAKEEVMEDQHIKNRLIYLEQHNKSA
ncbi:Deoxyribodipyrimidine photolyase, single-strand-specific [Arcticibacter svalbardensis MN12-7]|uniref:Deoxyribodipyrimidine photolyase, single-strand-specific n=1 Tax=Arcticibacter svalbardensis MN12-7 TaxID=1150600 RepID=R9GP17_9SPHI|nr:deoxyribodipyrimidine photo-lyase [Arcticibacter svalbardensis]EOR93270.1 Deoxyribodipyrimidine photolyase, single-strand-specific [Arcticibacter svalbardensis MN12-7]